jgi:hypothetical protein
MIASYEDLRKMVASNCTHALVGCACEPCMIRALSVASAVLDGVKNKMHHEWGDVLDWEDYLTLRASIERA